MSTASAPLDDVRAPASSLDTGHMRARAIAAIMVLAVAWVAGFVLPFATAGDRDVTIGDVVTGAAASVGGAAAAFNYLPVFLTLVMAGCIAGLSRSDRRAPPLILTRTLVAAGIATLLSLAVIFISQDLGVSAGLIVFALLLPVAIVTAIPLTIGQALLYPAMLYVIIVTQIPFLLTIYYSFQNYLLLRPDRDGFAGLDNYRRLWDQVRDTDSAFFAALINTVVLTAGSVILAVILGLALAELVNHKFPGRAIVRTLLITPFLIMPAAAALSWKNLLYNPNFGFLDWFIDRFVPFTDGPNWLGEYPLLSIMIYLVWRWAPFMMLIFLAGMGSISEEVREAARVDGASAWEEFRSVTLPHLRRFFMLGGLLGTVYIFQDFDPIYLMTQGGPGNESTNLSFLVYRTAISGNNYGLASAIGVVTVILSIIAVTYLVRLLSRVFEGDLSSGR